MSADNILFALWFFAPAGIANLTPILAAKAPVLKSWDYPMDFNLSWRGKRILGSHKTWRGILIGVIAGILTLGLQVYIFENSNWVQNFSPIDYTDISIIALGFLLSFGALLGDAIKSFFKRQLKVAAGRSWFPFDQLDYIVGGLLLSALYVQLTLVEYAWIVLLYFGLHLITSYVGYRLKLKDQPI